jgi:hypothetical protein
MHAKGASTCPQTPCATPRHRIKETDTMTNPATWWWTSDGGWSTAAPPEPFQCATSGTATTDWPTELREAGYAPTAQVGDKWGEDALFELHIWTHPSDWHWLVELWAPFGGILTFFVAYAHRPHFCADLLPKLLAGYGLNNDTALELRQLRRVLAAFISHGHGLGTVDEIGDQTCEEMQEALERSRRRIAEKGASRG